MRAVLLLAASLIATGAPAQTVRAPMRPPAAPPPQPPVNPADRHGIVAVVNGDVISGADVDNRRRLFALSTGMPVTPDILNRLTAQVTRQLIDERLRLQEVQRRKIIVSDQDIAAAIGQIESRNRMPAGTLRHRLEADGVSFRTLVDQIRVQIGWMRVLREELGDRTNVSDADIAAREAMLKAQTGQPEYRVSEIFIPVDDPAHEAGAQNFADAVIQQLRSGASFAVVAAQFSQSQTALDGGDLGWVQLSQLDPQEARVVSEMPEGAVSNPIRVAGGFSVVSLRGKRQVGNDPATMLSVREVFLPFSTTLDPANPTEQQKQTLLRAKQISATAHSCDAIEEANRAAGNVRPTDPGEVRLEGLGSPQLRTLLASLPVAKPSQPLVSPDGIVVMMVCSRDVKNLGIPSKSEIADRIVEERAELEARQLQRELRRRAVIEMRSGGA